MDFEGHVVSERRMVDCII